MVTLVTLHAWFRSSLGRSQTTGIYTIVPLKLDFAAEKGGMAVSAVWRLVYFLAPCPSEPKEQTAAHRRDALCPSPKIQKQAAFGIYGFSRMFCLTKVS